MTHTIIAKLFSLLGSTDRNDPWKKIAYLRTNATLTIVLNKFLYARFLKVKK